MLRAQFSSKNAFRLVGCALLFVLTCGPSLAAPSIDLSLNVFYANPSSPFSGGNWELVAKTNADGFGLYGLSALLTNVATTSNNLAPRAQVNGPGGDFAGFGFVFNTAGPGGSRNITLGQAPTLPGAGPDQTAFYGVGTLVNGAPNYAAKPPGSNSIGPLFTTLTAPASIPWATGDTFGDPAWATAAKLASGAFAVGVTPGFFQSALDKSIGNVFTTIGSSTEFGQASAEVTATTIVRTNFVANPTNGDYNRNGVVDAADYVVWRNTFGLTSPLDADGNGNGSIDDGDYTVWRMKFGNVIGAGSALEASAIPEPCGAILLVIGTAAFFSRRSRPDDSIQIRARRARFSGRERI
jgi:hypothetical protein